MIALARMLLILLAAVPASQPATAPNKIAEFQGEYRFLSNFWPAEVVYEGRIQL